MAEDIEIDIEKNAASNVYSACSRDFGELFGMKRALCPDCGRIGDLVPDETIAIMTEGSGKRPEKGVRYFICKTPFCRVLYFPENEGTVFYTGDLKEKLWFKEAGEDLPVCFCNRISARDIREAYSGGAKTVADVFAYFGRSPSASKCTTKNPTGRQCSGDIAEWLIRLEKESTERDETHGEE